MTSSAGVRTAVERALAVDRSGFRPLVALRAAVGVALPLAIGTAVGHPTEGAVAAAGALPAGIASIGGTFRPSGALVSATAVAMTVSTFVGGLVAGHLAPTLLALAVWGFAAGVVVVLGREPTVVATQAVVGLVVFGRFPGSVAGAAVHAAWVFAGAALQGVLLVVIRPPRRYVDERRALARAFSSLARLAHDVTGSGSDAAATAQAAADLVARRTEDEDVQTLRGLADEAARIRLELQSLASFAQVPGVEDVTRAAATQLRRLSQAVADGAAPGDPDAALTAAVDRLRADRETAPAGPSGTPVRYAAARASALLGQLRAVDRLVSAASGIRRIALPRAAGSEAVLTMPNRAVGAVRRVLQASREPGTPAFRHAVRLAVVLPLAELLSRGLPGQRGYWVTLTALVVLKPDYATTMQRGVARVAGTGLGVVLAGLVVVAVHPSGAAVTLLAAGFAWAAYTVFAASYALFSFAVTGLVVLLLAPTGATAASTVGDRGLDTLVGGALALVTYAVWPTWERQTLSAAVSRLLETLADYAGLVLSGYVDPGSLDRQALGRAANAARRARTDAQASLDRARGEPGRVGSPTDVASGVLAAARRVVIALHGLRTTLEDNEEHVPLPEVARARDAVTGALRGLAAGEPTAVEGLREVQQQVEAVAERAGSSLHARRLAVVAAHLDPLVDSIDTLEHVMDTRQPA